ncbi:MAG: hypothetical protein EZS28_002175 [Streblomastix strix]|uniref:Uncharacterized protein n=1 Tax=Streblomastix strix TaxID=222440 RepID=A0A5J4X4Z5_9EUKA|nr:MAG: hypothetical protein EZS28_002175 [Streblomastix strix]
MQLFLTNRIITQTISDIIDITMEFIQTVDSLPYIQDVYQKIRGTIITGTDMDVMISRLAADKLPSLALSTSAQTISDSIQTATLETKERIIEQVTEHINALQIEASQKFGLLYRMFSALHAELSSLALPLPGQSSVPQTATIAGAQRIHPNIIHLLTLLNYNGFASRLEESSKKI